MKSNLRIACGTLFGLLLIPSLLPAIHSNRMGYGKLVYGLIILAVATFVCGFVLRDDPPPPDANNQK